jgi:DNA primase
LFASQAAGDPIKKAESIKEIVTSIAQIPDPVKRSVYIQETSSLLKIARRGFAFRTQQDSDSGAKKNPNG